MIIEITKKFNDDIMFPTDIYTIDIYRYETYSNDKKFSYNNFSKQ